MRLVINLGNPNNELEQENNKNYSTKEIKPIKKQKKKP